MTRKKFTQWNVEVVLVDWMQQLILLILVNILNVPSKYLLKIKYIDLPIS
jgi:hypothetical protein